MYYSAVLCDRMQDQLNFTVQERLVLGRNASVSEAHRG